MRRKLDEWDDVDVELWADENGNYAEIIILDASSDEQLATFDIEGDVE